MRNDKKNPFFTNVGLFSTSLFLYRIHSRKDFPDHKQNSVREAWEALRKIWNDGESFLTSPKVNESDTEKYFIDPVFRALGFSYITKTKLFGVSREDKKYPDYSLFANDKAAVEAQNAEQDFKFRNALCLGEGKKFGFTLNELDDEGRVKAEVGLPAIQLTDYLRMAEVDWGVLTNGKQWQLYFRKGQYAATRYFEFNLVDLLNHREPTREFAAFLYLFTPDAFKRDKSGKCRLDYLYEESKKYAQEVGEPFYEGCRHALKLVFEFYQIESKATKNLKESRIAHQAALILLFRIIAIRYLEDRGVLPTQSGEYRDVSLDVARLLIDQTLKSGKRFEKSKTEIWNRMKMLFKDVNNGVYGIYIGHKGFESDLFELDFDKYFSSYPMSDAFLAEVIDSVCRGKGKGAAQIDFFDLGVEKIGDVYNDLLGLRLVNGDEGITLADSASKKKELGSYFTHPKLTQLLSDGILNNLRGSIPDTNKWLNVRFCDNSCGSGHFLRQMIEDISYEVYTARSRTESGSNSKETLNSFRRSLAQNCAFGIDRDINAVWLTKLSLWLLTAETGKPFVFLDHHIVNGDSILSSLEVPKVEAADRKEIFDLYRKLRTLKSENKSEIIESRKIWKEIQALTRKYTKHIQPQLDLFKLDEETQKSYFSYAQEFPEVFLNPEPSENGFDIVVGNPPWETIKPKIQDFYKNKTGIEKPPSRRDLDEWVEGDSKLSAEYSKWEANIKNYANSIRNAGYKLQKGEVYTYSYFTERSLQTLRNGGTLAYITKLGIYSDQSSEQVRVHMLREAQLQRLWIFRNNRVEDEKMFAAVAPNEKFAVFICKNTKTPKYRLQAKTVTLKEHISSAFEEWQHYNIPDDMGEGTVEVYDSPCRKSIASKLSKWRTVAGNNLKVGRELDLTIDRHLFSKTKLPTPIYTGYELRSFYLDKPENWCKKQTAVAESGTAKIARLGANDIIPDSRRKLRVGPIPAGVLTANSILVITGFSSNRDYNVVLAALNAMITEYVLRPKLSNMHLNNFRLESLPLPLGGDEDILDEIDKHSVALQKKANKDFESEDAYRRIEALFCVLYGISNEEIREYLDSFGATPKSFIDEVIDYVKVYKERFKIAKVLTFKPKTAFEKTVAQRLGVASVITEAMKDDSSFGLTKFEKLFYLVDMREKLQMKTEYYRQAYGPLDQRTLYNEKWGVLPLAQKFSYFSGQDKTFGESKDKKIKRFRIGANLKEGLAFGKEVLGDRLSSVLKFLEQFKKLNTDQTELVATVYAAWNDLLLSKKEPSVENVSREVLERWHPSKKDKFNKTKVANCMKWISEKGFAPTGFGKPTQTKPDEDDIGF